MCPPPEDADLAELFTTERSRARVNCGGVEAGAGSNILGARSVMLGAGVRGARATKMFQNSTGGSDSERKGMRAHSSKISWD